MAGRLWDEGPGITGAHVEELRVRMGLNQTELGKVLEVGQGHVSNWITGRKPVVEGPSRVLLRWLFEVYGVEGGRAPTPKIPVSRVPLRGE